MNTKIKGILTCFLILFGIGQANAAIVTVYPGDLLWGSEPGDTNSSITSSLPNSGNGSLELHGDRTRFFGLGNPYDSNSNLGLLADVTDFTFEWAIALSSVSSLHADYTPALRLHIFDGQQRSELIWEGAYNDTYGNTNKETWYQTSFSDYFWQYQSNIGVTAIYDRTISDWAGIYSGSAYVAAISIGVGSSVGNDYKAFADNVTLQFAQQEARTFNFETRDVPEPSAALLILFGLAGVWCRKRMK